MSQVLVRNLDVAVLRKLKARARKNGRSLQAEMKSILEQAARSDLAAARAAAARIRRQLAGRVHSDSAALLAEDRAR